MFNGKGAGEMVRKVFVLSMLVVAGASLSGCATGRKQTETDLQGLKSQVSSLEAQLQAKDEELYSLKEELARSQEIRESAPVTKKAARRKYVPEVKSRPSVKQIQAALLNAGYDPGPVDGKMGKKTRQAIRDFQAAHNLTVDGKVGKKTWSLMREYVEQKLK
jgi:outer membrane murein-binding lipoprotein Lpp